MTAGQITRDSAADAEVGQIVQNAERARMAGRREDSLALLAQAKSRASDHPAVLNALGVLELENGNFADARQLFERAIAHDDRNPAFWLNLASALHHIGPDPDGEIKALDRALSLDPRHLPSLLQKASLHEVQGRTKAAAQAYHSALQSIPADARLPEALRPALRRAVEATRANDLALRQLLGAALLDVRARHGDEEQTRFDHCIDGLLNQRHHFLPQPSFLYFPHLPAMEFYPRSSFPWLRDIEAATGEIRAELERVMAQGADCLEPYIAYPEGAPLDQWADLNHSRRWSVFYLWRDGKPVDSSLERCPRTTALLSSVQLLQVTGYAPTVFFSILDAKSRIPPHTGVTNTRLIVHLPLVVPPGCGFRVGAEVREWREGEALVFDDSIQHEAWNDSEQPRAVLIFDIWNPYLTQAERELVATAVQSIREYYKGEVTVGA